MKNSAYKKFLIIICSLTFVLYSNCSKKKGEGPIEEQGKTDIYVAGVVFKPPLNKAIGTLWKNGKIHFQTDGSKDVVFFDLAMIGKDLYAVGYEGDNQHRVAKVWKNGSPITIGNNNSGLSVALRIQELNAQPYVMVVEQTQENKSTIRLWNNGVLSAPLTDDTYAVGNQFLFNANEAYVVGYRKIGGLNQAFLLKNVQQVPLTTAYKVSAANDLTMHGNDVYIVGSVDTDGHKELAVVWKNGVPTYLTTDVDNGRAYHVTMAGNDLIVVRTYSVTGKNQQVTLWRNGVPSYITIGVNVAIPFGFHMKDSDVYISGYETDAQLLPYPRLWINSVKMELEGDTNLGHAYAVQTIRR
jgi:hypothetical protein